MKIDFVSDVSCPWCVIGLKALEQALEKMPELTVALEFQPFELNPQMGADGEDIGEHLARKYGASPQQSAAARENIRQRGAQLGFVFDMNARGRIYNTFDAHRLLHWAHLQSPVLQRALKLALFSAYFTDGRDPSDHAVLLDAAGEVGLDVAAARQLLASDAYAAEVREAEQHYRGLGIDSVPAIIINNKHLIQGGQPPEVFEQALRRIAGETAQA
ncbi:MAG: DsbA family oxidoreductase [Burkholderiaceae bacterium]